MEHRDIRETEELSTCYQIECWDDKKRAWVLSDVVKFTDLNVALDNFIMLKDRMVQSIRLVEITESIVRQTFTKVIRR